MFKRTKIGSIRQSNSAREDEARLTYKQKNFPPRKVTNFARGSCYTGGRKKEMCKLLFYGAFKDSCRGGY